MVQLFRRVCDCAHQATEVDLGRNSFKTQIVRSSFFHSFCILNQIRDELISGQFSRSRLVLEYVIFKKDKLFCNRNRILFNQPISVARPRPVLPKSVMEQVYGEFEEKKAVLRG